MSSDGILIVEDEAIVAMCLENELRGQGFEVLGIADRGEDAARICLERSVDVVLMDINLRGEMDGIQAARIIAAHRSVPIIFLSAFADEVTRSRAEELQPAGFLSKPVDKKRLMRAVAEALAASGGSRPD